MLPERGDVVGAALLEREDVVGAALPEIRVDSDTSGLTLEGADSDIGGETLPW